jgi:hypothetical protein
MGIMDLLGAGCFDHSLVVLRRSALIALLG